MNRIIVGNALDIVGREGCVLLHQVNCIRAAGAGIALQIRQRWPSWYEAYRNDKRKLGDATLVRVQPWPAAWLGNLYAQFTICASDGSPSTHNQHILARLLIFQPAYNPVKFRQIIPCVISANGA